ncbi:MAG: AAA family ATPase [Saprospiraceae bacterium]|nr:AAA family ATPase [Saprospiraceae bacterium]
MEKADNYPQRYQNIHHSVTLDLDSKVRSYFDLFLNLLEEATDQEGLHFNTLFSRLAFAGAKYNIPKSVLYYSHLFRKAVEKPEAGRPSSEVLMLAGYVLPALIQILGQSDMGIDISDTTELDAIFKKSERKVVQFRPVVEALVLSVDQENKQLVFIEEEDPVLEKTAKYDVAEANDIFTRNIELMADYFTFPVYVNLINVEITDNQIYIPAAFVIHPDYLVDVTAIAECFKPEGASPFFYLLSKIKGQEVSPTLIAGNIVNSFLDILMENPDADFREVMQSSFKSFPVQLSLLSDEEVRKMVHELSHHFQNLKTAVTTDFSNLNIHPRKTFTEPAFYSRDYGIQGRLDVLHFDPQAKNIDIIELKSGSVFKPNAYGINASHYIQTLLYDLMIKSAYQTGIKASCYILYSKISEKSLRFAPQIRSQQYEALKLRNQIILIEQQMQRPESLRKLLSYIKPENFPLVKGYGARDIENFYTQFNALSSIEKKYLLNYAAFISREQSLAKTGEKGSSGNQGLAALWLDTRTEKEERYAILYNLKITNNQSFLKEPLIYFERNTRQDSLSAFRIGDIAVLYPDAGDQSSILHHQIFKCTIIHIDNEQVVVRLRSTQHNQYLFEKHQYWIIEEDSVDSSFQSMYRSLFSFMQTPPPFRQKFLGAASPDKSIPTPEIPSYPELTEEQHIILTKIIRAQDYYLLWGPPGTGKTSVMLKYLVKYLFDHTSQNILLLSYTNRAVDEICESISAIGEDFMQHFIRVGSRYSTATTFQPVLLDQLASTLKDRNEVKQLIGSRRIFVSTVSSISNRTDIFLSKSFGTIIVDEASQIPEPMLAGLLSRCQKFVLIGDHKQLPAVVRQKSCESRIYDRELNVLGFKDTAVSLFERMYNQCLSTRRTDNIGIISMQGRMHRDLMQFPNLYFYQNQLKVLDKSQRLINERDWRTDDPVDVRLANHRMIFVPAPADEYLSNKTNIYEAEIVIGIIKKLTGIMDQNGIQLHKDSIGVITPYRAQIAMIRKKLQNYHPELHHLISVDTVERYQGGARDIIVISLCSNSRSQFMSLVSMSEDGTDRKLNVALTRAREQIILVGNETILTANETYARLLESCHRMEWVEVSKPEE